ncbi:unnamed protein product [Lampetra planeri]
MAPNEEAAGRHAAQRTELTAPLCESTGEMFPRPARHSHSRATGWGCCFWLTFRLLQLTSDLENCREVSAFACE